MPSAEMKAYLYAGGTVLLWSTVAAAFKLALAVFTPLQLLAVSVCTAAVCLALLCTCTGRLGAVAAFSRRELAWSLGLGLLTPFLYYITLFTGYALLPAQVAQPINYTWAMMLMFLSVPLLGHRVLPLEWAAAALSYAGVVVIVLGQGGGESSGVDFTGLAVLILSTAVWALYWIGNARLKVDPLAALTLNFLAALPCCLLLMWIVEPLEPTLLGSIFRGTDRPAATALAAAVYVGVVEMAVAFYFWLKALRLAPSVGRIAPLIYFSPFLSLIFINRFLGEALQPGTFLGLACIIVGCLLQRFALRRAGKA